MPRTPFLDVAYQRRRVDEVTLLEQPELGSIKGRPREGDDRPEGRRLRFRPSVRQEHSPPAMAAEEVRPVVEALLVVRGEHLLADDGWERGIEPLVSRANPDGIADVLRGRLQRRLVGVKRGRTTLRERGVRDGDGQRVELIVELGKRRGLPLDDRRGAIEAVADLTPRSVERDRL